MVPPSGPRDAEASGEKVLKHHLGTDIAHLAGLDELAQRANGGLAGGIGEGNIDRF
ncbi:MAG TPA: hypothetical protein VN523_00765 [Hyphomicrobiaceae bacterium]|jgi:hypothetical protein|nr:hypothetical protein [Hyphomicrobiaceae bacterium]